MTHSPQDELLLNAYLDGELDPIEATRFEERLGADAALNAQTEALRVLCAKRFVPTSLMTCRLPSSGAASWLS
jgi:anti-sigma factor RsiW